MITSPRDTSTFETPVNKLEIIFNRCLFRARLLILRRAIRLFIRSILLLIAKLSSFIIRSILLLAEIVIFSNFDKINRFIFVNIYRRRLLFLANLRIPIRYRFSFVGRAKSRPTLILIEYCSLLFLYSRKV